MFHDRKYLLLSLLLCTTSSVVTKERSRDFQQNASQVITTTLAHAQYAALAAMQSLDSMLYPALCILAGRSVYLNYLSEHLQDAPLRVKNAERFIPGGDTLRHMITYLAVGAGLFMGLNAVTDTEGVHNFLHSYMPNTASLVTYFKTQFTHPQKTITADHAQQKENVIICRVR